MNEKYKLNKEWLDLLLEYKNNANITFNLSNNDTRILLTYIEILQQENQQLKEKTEYLKSKIENKDNWCQLIADIGYDYDGFNKVDSLKGLIDELVRYALNARDDYDYLQWIEDGNNVK